MTAVLLSTVLGLGSAAVHPVSVQAEEMADQVAVNSEDVDIQITGDTAAEDFDQDVHGTVVKEGTRGNNVKWTLYEDGWLYVYGNGEISEETDKFPENENIKYAYIEDGVTVIGDGAFYGCINLMSIRIPEGVTAIGYSAFLECSSLTNIQLPDGVTSIGDYAFCWCTSLTSLQLPNSVTTIGDGAFEVCSSLASINIPAGVTSIGDYAFDICRSLTSISIPASVTSIGSCVFQECSSLASIQIPASVTFIGDNAFSGCSSLAIYAPSGSYAQEYASNNGINFVATRAGDINKDSRIDLRDTQLILRAALKIDTVADEDKFLYDVNRDTFITVKDAQIVLRAALGIEPIAP